MITTFVINLDKDTDRMAFMHEQLTACGMSYRRQPAILGKAYTPTKAEYDEEAALKATGHALIPGEMGCALSHAAVYKTIVAESLPFSFIFEDDVEIPKNFKEIIEGMATQQAVTKFDYLLFDYVPVGMPYIRQWFKGVIRNVQLRSETSYLQALIFLLYALLKVWYIVPLSLFEGVRDTYKKRNPGPVRFYRPVYFAGAYLVTLEGAKKLLSLAEPVIYTADQLPNKARVLRGLRFFCYAPRSVEQLKSTFGSSILDKTAAEIA
jgi:GR25 family glycosyltransferase involved in LPS biosynthesis